MGMELTVTLKVIAAMEFGKQLMVEFAVENIMSGKTVEQTAAMSTKLYKVQALLSTGSLYAALAEMQRTEPDENLSLAIRDKYILKLRKYLSI